MSVKQFRAPTERDLAFFQSVPWCARLLSDTSFTPVYIISRERKDDTEDSFFAETLQTPQTINHALALVRNPDSSADPPIQEIYKLLDVGKALNGFPNIAHGGFLAACLDEAMGVLLTINQEWLNLQSGGKQGKIEQFTAYLNITYKAPVKTPGVILATAKIVKTENRKWFIRATVEDENRNELTVGDALFIKARSDPRL